MVMKQKELLFKDSHYDEDNKVYLIILLTHYLYLHYPQPVKCWEQSGSILLFSLSVTGEMSITSNIGVVGRYFLKAQLLLELQVNVPVEFWSNVPYENKNK